MSDVSASAVASLRARTGVSMMECHKALTEAEGDEEKAIDILRSKGKASAVKKAGREQGEGYIFSKSDDGKVAIILLKCETDFVSRGDDFQAFGNELAELAFTEGEDAVRAANDKINAAVQKMGENITLGDVNVVEGETIGCYVHTNGKIGVIVTLKGGSAELARDVAMHAAAMNPSYISPDDVPSDAVEHETVIWKQQLKSEGKPEEIMEKILIGKENKFREENALLKQDFVKNPEQTIEQFLGDATIDSYLRVSVI